MKFERAGLPTYAFQRERFWLDELDEMVGAGMVSAAANEDSDLWDAVKEGALEGVSEVLGLPKAMRANLENLLPHLAAWRRERESKSQLSRWLYTESWQPWSPALEAGQTLGGTWVIVAPKQAEAITEPLSQALAVQGPMR